MLHQRIPTIFSIIRIFTDFFTANGVLIGAYFLRLRTDLIPGIQITAQNVPDFPDFFKISIFLAALFVFVNAINSQYTSNFHRGIREFPKIFISSSAWIATLITLLFFIFRTDFFSRLVLAWSWAGVIIFSSFFHIILSQIEKYVRSKIRGSVLILGKGKIAVRLAKAAEKHHGVARAMEWTKKTTAHEIWDARTDASSHSHAEILTWCRENNVQYFTVPSALLLQSRNAIAHQIAGLPVIELRATPLDGWGAVSKRIFDFFGALFGILIFSPIIFACFIAVRVDSCGNAIFKNTRVGRNQKIFKLWKFRRLRAETCVDTHDDSPAARLEQKLITETSKRDGALYKIENDPRETRVGRFLNKTSLDELPQFWNVLKGEMSLVGPRPHQPKEVKNYEQWQRRLFAIRPGITGLAQVSGRDELSFDEESRLDIEYIETWSIWNDIIIILKTFSVVFHRSLAKK